MCPISSGLLMIMLLIVDTVLFPVGLTLDLPYLQLWKTSFCLIFAIYLFGISLMHTIYFMVSMDRSPSLLWHDNISRSTCVKSYILPVVIATLLFLSVDVLRYLLLYHVVGI